MNASEFTNLDYLFPKSNFFVKASLFVKKGNVHKSTKLYIQGIENGCVHCIRGYTLLMFNEGNTTLSSQPWKENKNINLIFPLSLEGAIRGHTGSLNYLTNVCYVVGIEMGVSCAALKNYWFKDLLGKKGVHNMKSEGIRKSRKTQTGEKCEVCSKQDSDTVTLMRCEKCAYYYYCSSNTDDCQSKHWRAGHAGECRQLRILKKFHKPYGEKIRIDICNGIDPKDIPELQVLRHQLGLSMPKVLYQDLLNKAKSHSISLIAPRKDGTVQLGSFPGEV